MRPTSLLRLAFILAGLLFIIPALCMGASTAWAEQLVVSCDPERTMWQCDLAVDGHPTFQSTIPLTNCFFPFPVTVPPSGAAIIENYGRLRCGTPVHLAPFEVPARLSTIARSTEGMTIAFPALSPSDASGDGDTFRAAPIRTTGADGTFILAFNRGETTSEARLIITGSEGEYVATEFLAIEAGEWAFYEIEAEVDAGAVEIIGGYGIGPASHGEAFYYVVTGSRDGASAPRVFVP
jgi:hypothetical protein